MYAKIATYASVTTSCDHAFYNLLVLSKAFLYDLSLELNYLDQTFLNWMMYIVVLR